MTCDFTWTWAFQLDNTWYLTPSLKIRKKSVTWEVWIHKSIHLLKQPTLMHCKRVHTLHDLCKIRFAWTSLGASNRVSGKNNEEPMLHCWAPTGKKMTPRIIFLFAYESYLYLYFYFMTLRWCEWGCAIQSTWLSYTEYKWEIRNI